MGLITGKREEERLKKKGDWEDWGGRGRDEKGRKIRNEGRGGRRKMRVQRGNLLKSQVSSEQNEMHWLVQHLNYNISFLK